MTIHPPHHWPKDFIYSRESVASDLHPFLLKLALASTSPRDQEMILSPIEEHQVHPHIEMLMITDQHPYRRAQPHPLANLKTKKGHTQRGVFASSSIPSETVLGEYVGELYLINGAEDIEDIVNKKPFSNYTWMTKLENSLLLIDSNRVANELAFVNDYRGLQPEPNTTARWMVHRGSFYFVYVTTRNIERGEELLIKYGESVHW